MIYFKEIENTRGVFIQRMIRTGACILLCTGVVHSQTDTLRAKSAADLASPQIHAVPADASEGVEISAQLHPVGTRRLTVGDQFALTITVKHSKKMPVSPLAVDTIEPFAIVEQKVREKETKNKIVSTFDLKLAAFMPGDLRIPPFRVFFRTDPEDTILKSVATDSIPISIASVLPEDMKDINDIKRPIDFPNFLPLIIAGILTGAAILLYTGHRLMRRFRQMREMIKPLPPPWEEALNAINRIPVEEWLNNNLIKRYYYAISEILKRYLERRFLFPAAEQTTTELIRTMKQNRIPEQDGFRDFFIGSDMVKYAKLVPPRDEMMRAVDTVRELINKTSPEHEMDVVRKP